MASPTQLITTSGHEPEQTPGDSEGQGSPAYSSPWGCKESDTTERVNNNKVLPLVNPEASRPWRGECDSKHTLYRAGFTAIKQSWFFAARNIISCSHSQKLWFSWNGLCMSPHSGTQAGRIAPKWKHTISLKYFAQIWYLADLFKFYCSKYVIDQRLRSQRQRWTLFP